MPGDAVIFAHFFGGELVDVIESAGTGGRAFAQLSVLADPGDHFGPVALCAEDGAVAKAAVRGDDEGLVGAPRVV